jgi:hypothetical protein
VALPVDGIEQSLHDFMAQHHVQLSGHTKLETRFWPEHPALGIPDLALCFSGGPSSAFVLIVEAKLWSGKSGFGDSDQLHRYLKILKNLHDLNVPLSQPELRNATAALLYLTPHESLAEPKETSALCEDEPELREVLFRAQWQDILEAAEASHQARNCRTSFRRSTP